jgi:hypothetical protein
VNGTLVVCAGALAFLPARAMLRGLRLGRAGRAGRRGARISAPASADWGSPGWPASGEHEPSPEAPLTYGEELMIGDLGVLLDGASHGTRELAGELADRMRKELPDVPDATLAKVLLAVGRWAEDTISEQGDDHDAVTVIRDATAFAPVSLASLDMAFARREAR